MNQTDLSPAAVEKLAGADLRAFAAGGAGTRPVVVELDNPAPRAGAGDLPTWPRSGLSRPPLPRFAPAPPEPAADGDWAARMDDLERDLVALGPAEGPVRIDLARGFSLTVTPELLRAITRHPLVGVVRPRQGVTTARTRA